MAKQKKAAQEVPAQAEADAPAPVAAAPKARSRKARATEAVEAAEELAPAPEGQAEQPVAEPEVTSPAAAPAAEDWPDADEEWAAEVESAYLQSKYTLVSVAAKRARQLLGGSKRRVDSLSEKPVTVALEELASGKLYFERTRDGIK